MPDFGTLLDKKIVGKPLASPAAQSFSATGFTRSSNFQRAPSQETDDQFRIFQLGKSADGPSLIDVHDVEPELEGSDEEPDVRIKIELVAFHAGRSIASRSETGKATLRFDIGQDSMSSSQLQPLFWSIAAGMDLHRAISEPETSNPSDFRHDFASAFSRRPEIGGGLAEFRFEVFAHREAPWYQRIFTFMQSDTGKALTAAVGFPGVVPQAIKIVNEAFNHVVDDEEPLFKSAPMTLGLTKYAVRKFTGDNQRVKVGVLNPGHAVLVPKKYYQQLADENLNYLATYGMLVKATGDSASMSSQEDPFPEVPYAVLKVGADPIKVVV